MDCALPLDQNPPEPDLEDYPVFVRTKIKRALFLVLLAAVILLVTVSKPAARGLVLGGLFSALNFYVMSRVIGGRVMKTGWPGRTFGFFWLLARMGIMALPLIAALKMDFFNLAATAAGLFAIQASLLLEPLLSRLTRR
jgi:hypothetical protein